ncbi:MAG: TolC family protein [Gemmatimonadetes bacterium]|nr:TolC family protein [Gemmatimonadota bacterium]
MVRWVAAGALALAATTRPAVARAQGAASDLTGVTRADAVAAALAHGSRMAVARADTTLARAGVMLARQFENPAAGWSYTKAVPQQHYSLSIPIDLPWLRDVRIGSAEGARAAAQHRYRFERYAVAYDADTTYTRALSAVARARLSRRTAHDADSLLALARLRRDAGDGSELDVQLAAVSAGQLANAAATDSLDAAQALLQLQLLMGLPGDAVTVAPSDSLTMPPARDDGTPAGVGAAGAAGAAPLLVAAAQSDVVAAEQALAFERRRFLAGAALSVGWDKGDPTGAEPGVLPTVGISLPLPLFNRNDALVLAAQSQAERARAQLALARIQTSAAITLARRTAASTVTRAERSARLVANADRVAALSLTAFSEGAAALPSVLVAQRTARETLAQYITDVAAARNALGLLDLLTLTATGTNP